MILPAKHIPPDRSIIGIGAKILKNLDRPKSVSEAWNEFKAQHSHGQTPVSFDWFILALTWLFAVSAVSMQQGLLRRAGQE
jgi:hypothetical protein